MRINCDIRMNVQPKRKFEFLAVYIDELLHGAFAVVVRQSVDAGRREVYHLRRARDIGSTGKLKCRQLAVPATAGRRKKHEYSQGDG